MHNGLNFITHAGNKSPTATAAAAKNVPGFHHTSSASCPQGQAQVEGE